MEYKVDKTLEAPGDFGQVADDDGNRRATEGDRAGLPLCNCCNWVTNSSARLSFRR